MKPRLLDLFCGAGGAAMGYHRAGFEVVGVDINPQPHYPFPMIQRDALEHLRLVDLSEYDVIHASPPCQAYSSQTPPEHRSSHPDLLAPTRDALMATGLPYVIENVPGAPIFGSVMLCGSSFGLVTERWQVRRHRYFETNPPLLLAPPCQHRSDLATIDLTGGGGAVDIKHRKGTADERREATGIDWMTRDEIAQAIPPAYTEWIGHQILAAIEMAAA